MSFSVVIPYLFVSSATDMSGLQPKRLNSFFMEYNSNFGKEQLSDNRRIVTSCIDDKIRTPYLLFKFREYSNVIHQTIIKNREVYFASPNSFSDKDDCHNKYPELSQTDNDIFRKHIDDRVGVLSLATTVNSEYLWKIYSKNHTGFVVGFYGAVLAEFAHSGGNVTYHDSLSKVSIIDSASLTDGEYIARMFYAKKMQYSAEEEYRLIRVNIQGDDSRKVRLPVNAYGFFMIGRNMPLCDIHSFLSLIPQELKHVPVLLEPNHWLLRAHNLSVSRLFEWQRGGNVNYVPFQQIL